MTLKEIVLEYLKKNDYDGLFRNGECGCKTDDLMPCEGVCDTCEPGYLKEGDEEFDYFITPDKEERTKE